MISKTVQIEKSDIEFLRSIARGLNHQVRLLWSPAPKRNNPQVTPTEVTVVAEEMPFVDYTLYELEKFRGALHGAARLVDSAKPAPTTVTF